jgi:hypothetical protein
MIMETGALACGPDVDSQARPVDVLRRLADHPASRLSELLTSHRQLSAKGAAAA